MVYCIEFIIIHISEEGRAFSRRPRACYLGARICPKLTHSLQVPVFIAIFTVGNLHMHNPLPRVNAEEGKKTKT